MKQLAASWVNPSKPPFLREEVIADKSGGDKDDRSVWRRTSACEPVSDDRELVSMKSSGWCRLPGKTSFSVCKGKGSFCVVDRINGAEAVRRVMGR